MNTYCVPSVLLAIRVLDEHTHRTGRLSASGSLILKGKLAWIHSVDQEVIGL